MSEGSSGSAVRSTSGQEPQFTFVRHGDHTTKDLDWDKGPEQVRKALSEALGARNIAFLLGAGCSSMIVEKTERGIPTMAPLATEFCRAAAKVGRVRKANQGDSQENEKWSLDMRLAMSTSTRLYTKR